MLMSPKCDKYYSLSHLADVPKRVYASDLLALCEQDRKERSIKIVKCVTRMIKGQVEQSRGLGPEWDSRHQRLQRIVKFVTESCATVGSCVKDLLMSGYRDLAQDKMDAESTAIFEICHKLEEAKEKAAKPTIWGRWRTKGCFQCRLPGQDHESVGVDKSPQFFVKNALDSDPNNANPIGVCCIHDGNLKELCLLVGDAESLMVHQKNFHVWFCKNHRCKGLPRPPATMGMYCPVEGSWHDVEEHMKNCPWDRWDDNVLTISSE